MSRSVLYMAAAAAAAAFSSIAAAEGSDPASTILSVPFWGYDPPASGLAGSVIAVGSDATTLSLNCINLAPGSDGCGLFPSQTLVYGPASYHMDMRDTDFTATEECAFDRAQITAADAGNSAVTAVCTQSISGAAANDPGSDVGTLTDGTVWPVTITAGLGLLVAPGSTATPTALASTTTGSSHGGATTGAGVSGTGAAPTSTTGGASGSHSGSHTASAASTASTSTGVAVRVWAPMGGMGLALGAAAGYMYA